MVAGVASGICGVALTGGPIPSTTVTVVCGVVSGVVVVLAPTVIGLLYRHVHARLNNTPATLSSWRT
jgi:hypothetical protein